MPDFDHELVLGSVHRLLHELLLGPHSEHAWVLNPQDTGFVEIMDRLTADQASSRPIPNRSSIAGHANHIRYSLDLLNRWAAGENPYSETDWPGSWRIQSVTDDEWKALKGQLRREAEAWLKGVMVDREWDEMSLTGVLASASHVAYHTGAVRQVLGAIDDDASRTGA